MKPSILSRLLFLTAAVFAVPAHGQNANGPAPSVAVSGTAREKVLEEEITTLQRKVIDTKADLDNRQGVWEAQMAQSKGKLPPDIAAILALEPTERDPSAPARLREYYHSLSPWLKAMETDLAARKKELAALQEAKAK